MRVAFISLLLTLTFLSACSQSPTEKLVGSWKLDATAVKEVLRRELSKTSPMGEMLERMVDSLSGSAEFEPDGTATMTLDLGPLGEKAEKSRYRVEGSGEDMRLVMIDDGGQEKRSALSFETDDRIAITRREGNKDIKMFFDRVQN